MDQVTKPTPEHEVKAGAGTKVVATIGPSVRAALHCPVGAMPLLLPLPRAGGEGRSRCLFTSQNSTSPLFDVAVHSRRIDVCTGSGCSV